MAIKEGESPMVKQIDDLKLYSVKDLNEALGVNERTIRDWFNKKRLRGVKIGTEWYISSDNLKKFLNAEEGGEVKDEKATRQLRSLKPTAKKKGGKVP
jgi:excisionase family DNA binding protein